MKILKFLSFAALIIFLLSFVVKEKIPVKIFIENPENVEFKGGKLIISKSKEEISITNLETKEILVDEGKHQFKFISETPHYVTYPAKINSKNNIIKIGLLNSKNTIESGLVTDKNFQEILKSKKLQFVNFGIVSRVHPEFEKKYGIKIKNEGCVITPTLSEKVTKNNQLIAEYLTKNFGDSWKTELGFLPYGL